MDNVVVKESPIHGLGLFAARNMRKGEHILRKDLTKLRKYTLEELNTNPDGDHSDYVGHGKYVIDYSLGAYINHSCDPNCYQKSKSIAFRDIYALSNIEKGEEVTLDYTSTAVDQFAGKGFWVIECKCGSKNCRGKVTGDLFQLPRELQRIYYAYLPPYIKRKYRLHFAEVERQLRNYLSR